MSKMKQIAALTAMLVGVILYASPAKSAVCFLPDDDGSCGGGDIEISDGSGSDDNKPEEKCEDFPVSAADYEKMKNCFDFTSCTKSKTREVKYKQGGKISGTNWNASNKICCTNGETYDSAEGQCCPTGGCTHECDAPKEWSTTLRSCECPNGKETSTGTCCADEEHVDGAICCPEKKHNDGGVCVCDSQYNTDKDGNCVLPTIDNNLYLQVYEGNCYRNVVLEGTGVEAIGNGLYKIAYGSTVNIKYDIDETTYSNGKITGQCTFYNWEFDNIASAFVNDSFNYDEDMYKKLISSNDVCSSADLGSRKCPEQLNTKDDWCDGPCETTVEIASISASRVIPYVLGVKTGGNNTYTDEMNNKYQFYVLYEPGKNVTQYNATAYKCHMSQNDGTYRNNLPAIDYNYIGWFDGKTYLVGKASRTGTSEVFNEMSFVVEGKEKSSNSDIIIRDTSFGVYDNQSLYDTISNNYKSEHIVYCEPFKLENDKYALYTLDVTVTDYMDMVEGGVLKAAYWETTGKALPDNYLEVTREMVKGNTNKTTFSYKFVGNDFPNNNSSECKISCGDKDWNESINNGNGVTISCKNGGCANGKTGTITADYIVGKSLEPKNLLPTGCTCHCTKGYTCIIK